MISVRTKVLIGLAALPVVAVVIIVVLAFAILPFSGLGIDLPVFHTRRIVTLLIVWLGIIVSAVISFRRDRGQNTNG